ncbi:MAG TPA: CaiB/BaiF CoA-transferase family protein [Acidimicrobiales bacterium]|nr:CaiB/BaiF CoA-transferase family protein [Acidimicrobiales bacterium]
MSGPLDGLKVIELAGLGPAPYACMLLADLGADVLRLERGDPDADAVTTHDLLNRSRDSVALDLKSDAGRELVLDLCEQAHVLIEAFRPGVTERLGLGPDQVLARNPSLVYGRMTGFGQEGVLAQSAGHDINYIAISGALWPIGRSGERPVPPLNFVGDFGGGAMFLALGVLAGVLWARQSGEGQVVDAAMVDGSASLLAMTHSLIDAGVWHEERGANILDSGAPFYEVYETSDHGYVAVGAIEESFYRQLLDGLGLGDAELPAQMDRKAWPEMKARFARIFAERTRDEWTSTFEGTDACVTPVLAPREAAHHRYNVDREVFDTSGAVQPRPAPRFSRTPGSVRQPPTRAGSGTRAGLLRWGVSEDRLAALRESGAFGRST